MNVHISIVQFLFLSLFRENYSFNVNIYENVTIDIPGVSIIRSKYQIT